MSFLRNMNFASLPVQYTPNEPDGRRWDDLAEVYSAQTAKSFHKDGSEDSVNNSEEDTVMGRLGGAEKSDVGQHQRRKEQNRAAQRAFRERKERYVKELEDKIQGLQKSHAEDTQRLRQENDELRDMLKRMESEMYTLKGAAMAFEVSMNKLREAGIDLPQSICELTPPSSERLSTTSSAGDMLSPSLSHEIHQQPHRSSSICDEEMREHEEFASANDRFEHKPDPITFTDAVLIPCSEVWDRLHNHERMDEIDLAKLCSEVKKRSKCSGSGPVIEERELMIIVNEQLGEGA